MEKREQSDRYHPDGEGSYHDRDPIDRRPSSGAKDEIDAKKDEREPPRGEAHTGTTTFDPEDAPKNSRTDWKRLYKRDKGHQSMNGDGERRQTYAESDIRMVADRLEISKADENDLVGEYRSTSLDELGNPRYESVILALVTLKMNEKPNPRWIQRRGANGDPLSEAYHDIRESFNVSGEKIRKLRKQLRN